MAVLGRGVSMFSLITDGVLDPGEDVLTFDYLGKRYSADLLPEGTIQSNGQIFASPYAWASYCKNTINPDQKTAIGWGHIRYKGIKLSQYKSIYMKKHKMSSEQDIPDNSFDTGLGATATSAPPIGPHPQKKGKRKKTLAVAEQQQTSQQDSSDSKAVLPSNHGPAFTEGRQAALSLTSELVTCSELGEGNGPFQITVSSNVLLLMDFHSHMCWSEVVGYLAGSYNAATKELQLDRAFPCQCNTSDEQQSTVTEKEIKDQLIASGLSLVGWYHSHPSNDAMPTVSDVTQQLMYQETLKSAKTEDDSTTPPCVGFIIGPNLANRRTEIQSGLSCYYVERRDALHASPFSLTYSISWEQFLTQDIADKMNSLIGFYRNQQDSVNFKAPWREGIPFIHKLKTSLANFQPKFEQVKSDYSFFTFIDQLALQNS